MVVVVEPSGIRLEPEPGETVFAAAARQGYRWSTVCGGQGSCRTCVMEVVSGHEHCSPMTAWEAEGIDTLKEPRDGGHRLACQTRVSGDVVVRKTGVRLRARAAGRTG